MLCYVILSFPLFKSSTSHTSLLPSPSSYSSSSSSMSCSNHHSNFSRKPRMSVRQVWKHKTSTLKSSPSSQKDSPPLPPRVYLQSPSPLSYNPLRDQMINQLHNISTILDSHTNPSNAYIHAPPSPPPQQIHPPSHAQNVQGRQIQGYTGSIRRGIGSGITWVARTVGDLNANPPKVIKFYNWKGIMLNTDGLEGFDSDYEDLQLNDTLILMTEKVDAFDSDYDDELTASAIFMAKLSPVGFINGDEAEPSYDSDILFEVSNYENYHANDMFNPFVQELSHTEQPNSVNDTYVDVLNDRYVISNTSYTDYNENEVVQDMTSLAQNDVAIL
ncbi:hypothetical protein Tco_0190870 [Tanacetum coccineum]